MEEKCKTGQCLPSQFTWRSDGHLLQRTDGHLVSVFIQLLEYETLIKKEALKKENIFLINVNLHQD